MDYSYVSGDEDAVVATIGPHFGQYTDPMDVQVPISTDPVWRYTRFDLQAAGNRLLRLELDEDYKSSSRVSLRELEVFAQPGKSSLSLSPDEQKLWTAVASHPSVPPAMETIVRDLLLSTGADASPANADKVVSGYRKLAQGPDDSLHVALAILRANTVARSRKMAVESVIRADALVLAERALTTGVLPGISTRHASAVAAAPRTGNRAVDELARLAVVLDAIEAKYLESSTIDWVAECRLSAAETDEERDAARRRHVEQYIALSEGDDVAFRSMFWAERAVSLATDYGIRDLHDTAVVRMQKLSREDLGWHHTVHEITIPSGVFRQQSRLAARFSSWEQALTFYLAKGSPSGSDKKNRRAAAGIRTSILDLATGRTFGSHQLPERTHGAAEVEKLNRMVQSNLAAASVTLRIDLNAIASRFGIPDEDSLVTFLSSYYGSAPALLRPFAQALRLHWTGDASSAARLAIPLVETGARELLFFLDEPLYRLERGASPGRFPAMDFYMETLEDIGFDQDWLSALRGTLLSSGMNLRNRLAHGFQVDFSAEQSALVIRLAGLFVGMPVGLGAIEDEDLRNPIRKPRQRLRRRLGWVWY